MSEHDTQSKIFDYLVSKGYLMIRVNSGRRGVISFVYWMVSGGKKLSAGVSDLIGLSPDGHLVAIECKDVGKKPTPEQLAFLAEVRKRNGFIVIAERLEDITGYKAIV